MKNHSDFSIKIQINLYSKIKKFSNILIISRAKQICNA